MPPRYTAAQRMEGEVELVHGCLNCCGRVLCYLSWSKSQAVTIACKKDGLSMCFPDGSRTSKDTADQPDSLVIGKGPQQ